MNRHWTLHNRAIELLGFLMLIATTLASRPLKAGEGLTTDARSPHLSKQSWKLTAMDGSIVTPKSLTGKPRLLVFSRGFRCGQCTVQIHALEKQCSEFSAAGMDIHVFVSDSEASLRKAIADRSWSFQFLADPDQRAFESFLCSGKVPLHGVFLVDRDGDVRWSQTGNHPLLDIDRIFAAARDIDSQDKDYQSTGARQ